MPAFISRRNMPVCLPVRQVLGKATKVLLVYGWINDSCQQVSISICQHDFLHPMGAITINMKWGRRIGELWFDRISVPDILGQRSEELSIVSVKSYLAHGASVWHDNAPWSWPAQAKERKQLPIFREVGSVRLQLSLAPIAGALHLYPWEMCLPVDKE